MTQCKHCGSSAPAECVTVSETGAVFDLYPSCGHIKLTDANNDDANATPDGVSS